MLYLNVLVDYLLVGNKMKELFVAGIQYLGTIVTSADGQSRLDSLEKALAYFEPKGVYASLETAFASNVSIDVYVDVAGRNERFRPPLVNRDTAQAYNEFIRALAICGYSQMELIRDPCRTGLKEPNENPLFEIAESTVN